MCAKENVENYDKALKSAWAITAITDFEFADERPELNILINHINELSREVLAGLESIVRSETSLPRQKVPRIEAG